MTARAAGQDGKAGATATTDKVKRSMGQQTWKAAAREVGRSALRHKVLSAVIAVCVAGSLVAIGVVGSGGAARPGRGARVQPPAPRP